MSADTALSERRRRLLEELLSGARVAHARFGDRVQPRPSGETAPLSAEQKHVWLHASMAPEVPLYNEAITIHRRGSFGLGALEKALNEILRRHEMWRSSIEQRDERLCMVVHPDLRLTLPLRDLTVLPEAQREAAALRIATEDALKPFDLARAPLLRATVVRLSPAEHRLYITLHHIVFDGVSIYRIILPELCRLYGDYARGEEPDLPEPGLQYGDYAAWREHQLASDTIERELQHWRRKLSGELPNLALPADRRQPSVPSHRGAMETFRLTPKMTAALREFGRREGITLYAILLAAFKALLHRYSGQEDIVVGGVTDMRRRPELENVVGYFLNSLALRTQPRGATPFLDYVHQVQSTVIEALDASDIPFESVLRDIAPKRDGSRHPLFQVLFSIEPPAPEFPAGWSLTQMDVPVGAAKFDLYLELDQEPDCIIGRFLYATDIFDMPTIRRMIGHWETLLDGVVRDPRCTLAELPLLTPAERQEIGERNRTTRRLPRVRIDRWIEEQARRRPEATAVECGGVAWRYRELMERATAIAARLRGVGAGDGTLVGIAMERSCDMVAGLLAILKTGAAYLPLDPDLPEARLRLLLEDARPGIVLGDQKALAKLPSSNAAFLLVDDTAASFGGGDEPPQGDPDALAYVLYTSGSTGRPKAVEIRQRSVVNLLAAVREDLKFGARDTFLALTTLSFDIAALELFLPLVSGAKLVIARSDEARDPARLAALIARSGCTTIQATPATWRGLLATGWNGMPGLSILCGGEALTPDLAAALRQRCAHLWNMYGPTETTIWSLRHKLEADEELVPIGRPLANTRVYILDGNGAPVPDLVPGELMIAGEGLARGYRNDPALTAQKFVTADRLGGERLYRTGDRARYRRDGTIEFLGRIDNQVKIRGFRVGLEEVEAAIASHPDVAACAVAVSTDPSAELRLIAYLHGPALNERDLPAIRDFLRRILPAYMVPTSFMILPALPMTPNGKVDRKRLPPPRAPGSEAQEPRDALEKSLAAIWKSVLGVKNLGIHDDFFDLGGHSLLAGILVGQIEAELRYQLPLAALFRSPTIARLAQALRSERGPVFSHLVRLRPGKGRPIFIVHGIFGNVLQLKDLAYLVDTARPIYAIQARGADPRQQPHTEIAEMVAAYIEAIRSVQPKGPYALGGYSFGGLIAFEMARRLRAHGEAVDLLAVFETDLYARYLPWRNKLAYRSLLTRRVFEKLRVLPARSILPYLLSKILQLGHRLSLRFEWRRDFVDLDGLDGPMAARYREMYGIGAREFVAFRPKPYDGKLSVFRIRGPRYGTCDPMPIWRRAVSAIELFEIEGDHGTIMEKPYVATLAAQFSRCLAAAQFPARAVAIEPRHARVEDFLSDSPSTALQGGS